jgi:GNAT superfamily N-acetyltransferase
LNRPVTETASARGEAGAVRKATAGDAPLLAAALARAFYDDPPTCWVLRDDSRRLAQLERSFALSLRRIFLAHDECYTNEGIGGGAMWAPPGRWHLGVLLQLRLIPALLAINGRAVPRLLQALNAADSNHPKTPHYYLAFLGVEPRLQGKGIGSALLRQVLDRCDRERTPAYLEASTPRNRTLYERHGFEVTQEFLLGKGSPPLWRMWRAPSSSAA